MKSLDLVLAEMDGRSRPIHLSVEQVLLAGYTGRDRSRVTDHVRELAALGVTPPEHVPMIYVIEPELITTDTRVVVNGSETSGEVELLLLPSPEGLLVGVGSDHTDRRHETIDVAASKRMCPKPIGGSVWRYEDLMAHWDMLELRAWVSDNGGRRLYQEGRLDALMRVEDLMTELRTAGHGDLRGRAVFGGTLPLLDGFVFGEHFEVELHDPVLGRRIGCGYDVVSLTQ